MIKYRVNGFNEFDEICIFTLLAETFEDATFMLSMFDLDDMILEELEVFYMNN